VIKLLKAFNCNWKLREIRREFEKGRCPLCLEEEHVKLLLNCLETKITSINEVLTYNRIINYAKVLDCMSSQC
jgi:hypothetical protein